MKVFLNSSRTGKTTAFAKAIIAQAIADGLNELGYGVDIPDENGEYKFTPDCHEVRTITMKVVEALCLK